jgi:hypothetical protein
MADHEALLTPRALLYRSALLALVVVSIEATACLELSGLAGMEATGTGGAAGDAAGTGGTAGDAAGTGGTAGDSGSTSVCPASYPVAPTTCMTPQVSCSYGDSVLAVCRSRVQCHCPFGCAWVPVGEDCDPDPGGNCPEQSPATQDPPFEECPDGALCGYDDGYVCLCTSCGWSSCEDGYPLRWRCTAPPGTSGCPTRVPNEGTSCSTEGHTCRYLNQGIDEMMLPGPVTCHLDATCTRGAWAWQHFCDQ